MPAKKANKGKKKVKEQKAEEGKIMYRFGKRKLNLHIPKDGYPTPEEAKAPFDASLELEYAHGYMGSGPDSRQNLYVSNDGNYLVYYLAAVVVIHDLNTGKQRFFTAHNDDVTALGLDTRDGSKLVASGQTDPIDRPGEGKDLPKVWIWNLEDLSKVELIDKICWGYINKVHWSAKSGYIYVLCGDEDQTLKVFDPESLTKEDYKKIEKAAAKNVKRKKKKSKDEKKKAEKCNYESECLLDAATQREHTLGFIAAQKCLNDDCVDELLFYCKRKFCYAEITKKDDDKLKMKFKAVSTSKLYKAGEKQFSSALFLNDDGYYAVGAQSGQIFIGKGFEAISLIQTAHLKSVGILLKDPTANDIIYSGGFDKKLVKWKVNEDLAQFHGKKAKDAGLEKQDTYDIHIDGSDMAFHPKAAAIHNGTNKIYVGTKSNHIIAIDEKERDKANVIVDGHDDQIWGLATHPEKDYYVTGGYDNALKLWNASTLKCEQTYLFPPEEKKDGKKKSPAKQIVTCAWSSNGKWISVGTEDSNIALFSYDDGTNKFKFETMHKIKKKSKNSAEENVSYLRFSPSSKVLAVAHMDSQLYLFTIKVKDGKPHLDPWKPMVHSAAPTHIQWAADGKLVKTFTRDYEICHWKLTYKKKTGKFDVKPPHPDEAKWSDDPLIAGWDVQGCYQPQWDGTDLNDVTMSKNGKFVITSDDFGFIRLHPYPAIEASNCKKYNGHAEFVVGVEMLRSGNQCISVGGADCAIFHWKATGLGGDNAEAKQDENYEEPAQEEAPAEEEAAAKEDDAADEEPAAEEEDAGGDDDDDEEEEDGGE